MAVTRNDYGGLKWLENLFSMKIYLVHQDSVYDDIFGNWFGNAAVFFESISQSGSNLNHEND